MKNVFILALFVLNSSLSIAADLSSAGEFLQEAWNCKPMSKPNDGPFDLNYTGKSPINTLFGVTDSASVGDGLDGVTITNSQMGDTTINFNDETEVEINQVPYDVTRWGNDLPTNKGGIQYTLILPKVIGLGSSFGAILWKIGPKSVRETYICNNKK